MNDDEFPNFIVEGQRDDGREVRIVRCCDQYEVSEAINAMVADGRFHRIATYVRTTP